MAVNAIEPNPFQPRSPIDQESIAELARSIRQNGVMQPIVVRPAGDGSGRHQLIAGERRWRAAQHAGLSHVPAIVRPLDDRDAAEWAIVENVQREDLNPIDRARAYRNLASTFGVSHQEIADRVGVSRSAVSNALRLLDLEPRIQELLASGALTTGAGKALLAIAPGPQRIAAAERAAAGRATVRDLERLATRGAKPGNGGDASALASAAGPPKSAGVADLERRLGEHLGSRVRIDVDRTGRKGRIVVSFYDLDHFDGLMRTMGLDPSTGPETG